MASFPSVLPRGSGTNRRGFEAFIKSIATYYPKAYRDAYYNEVSIILTDLIENTPIDTGYAAGVTSNKVGSQKRLPYPGHKAYGSVMSNDPGGSGWQMKIAEDSRTMKIAIVNPQWDSYLKFLESGIVAPVGEAKSHFVFNAWKRHEKRRDKIRKEVKRGRT
jgi:hypothetical protein